MLPARVKTDAVVASTGMGCKRKRLEGLIVEKRLLLLLPPLLLLLLFLGVGVDELKWNRLSLPSREVAQMVLPSIATALTAPRQRRTASSSRLCGGGSFSFKELPCTSFQTFTSPSLPPETTLSPFIAIAVTPPPPLLSSSESTRSSAPSTLAGCALLATATMWLFWLDSTLEMATAPEAVPTATQGHERDTLRT